MSYAVKEIFLTLQGEGAHAGRAGQEDPVEQARHVGERGGHEDRVALSEPVDASHQ